MTLKERLLSPPGLTVFLFALIFLSLSATGPNSRLTAGASGIAEMALGLVLVANAPLVGRLIAGLLVGFRFWGLTSGPLALDWDGNLPSFALRWKWYPFPGSVTLSPKSRDNLERKSIIILAGGILILSITTLLAFVLPWLGIVTLNNVSVAARFGGLTFLTYSILRGEGRLIYEILKNRPRGREIILGHVIDADVVGLLRPREWDLEAVEEVLGSTVNDPLKINCALVAHLHVRDAGNFMEAAHHFDIAADGLLTMQPKMAAWMLDHSHFMALGFADAISFLAAYQIKPTAECRRWLYRLADAVTDRDVVLRAEVGVLLAEGSPTLARGVAREAQSRIRGSAQINAGWKLAAQEWLAEIIQLTEQPDRAPVAKSDQPLPGQEESRYRIAPSYTRVSWQQPALGVLLRLTLVPFLAAIVFAGWRLPNPRWLLAVLLTIVLLWFISTTRALGRLVCSRLTGYTPVYFFAGPLLISFKPRWRFQLNRHPLRYFGYEIAMPPAEENLTKKALVRASGGAIGMAVTAVLLLVVYLFDSSLHVASSGPTLPYWVNLALFVLILSLLFCMIALTAGLDAQPLRILFGGGPRAQAWAATEALDASAETGQRPRAWRRDWIELATANVQTFVIQHKAQRLAYFHALDLGDIDRAERELYRAFRSIEAWRKRSLKTTMLPHVQVEAAFFQARYRGNVEQAADWLVKCNTGIVPKRTWLRAQAALLHASGDMALAEKTAREALAAPRFMQAPGIAILEDEWLAELAEIKRAVPRDNPPPATLRPIKLVTGWNS